jgi:chitinase
MLRSYLYYLIPAVLFSGCVSLLKPSSNNRSYNYDDRVVAYVTEWQNNWGKDNQKALQVTHINYAFANIKDGRVVEGGKKDEPDLKKLNELKKVNPELKILISIGGWGWSGGFSDAVLTPEAREIFANSAVDYMLRHKIDGIDLDWEYPGLPGAGNTHRPEDKENFTAILKLIREKLDTLTADGHQPYLLTIASAASQRYLDHTEMDIAHQYLDFINIMTYDYYTGGSPIAGHHSNLYRSGNTDDRVGISSALAVEQHIKAGIPLQKIVLGVPFYGRYWTGTNPDNNGLYQSSEGKRGSYSFKDIAAKMEDKDGFKMHWDSTSMAPYLWRAQDGQFVTYENPASLKLKTEYVKTKGMGGIMFWQYNGDNGDLLQTIFDNLAVKK